MQNSVAFLYADNENTEKEIKKTIPFALTSKNNRIPGKNFN
jgi:hypothetical protein